MHGDDQVDSDEALVQVLLEDQFPEWAALPIRRLQSDGTDNALYRLGDDLVVRLPLIHWAVDQVDKEHTWLPKIASLLPLAVPEPLVMGQPLHGYPWHWSVYRWIDGENAHPDRLADARQAAMTSPSSWRLCMRSTSQMRRCRSVALPLVTQDEVTRRAINAVRHEFDADALTAVWEEAITAPPWTARRCGSTPI